MGERHSTPSCAPSDAAHHHLVASTEARLRTYVPEGSNMRRRMVLTTQHM